MAELLQELSKTLKGEGVRYALGVTGSGSSLSLITELEDRGIRYIPTAHEGAAAIMAGTLSQILQRPQVSISIKGPGVANMLPGIVHNSLENNPALSLSEAYGDDSPPLRQHKRIPQREMITPLVKGMLSCKQLDSLPPLLRLATTEPPGPVHLELASVDLPTIALSQGASKTDQSWKEVEGARKPVLIVGSVAWRSSWKEKLTQLKLPIFTTAAAKGVIDERLPYAAGVYTGDGQELAPETHLLSKADLVLGLGLRNQEILSPKSFDKPTLLTEDSTILDYLTHHSWGLEQIAELREMMQQVLLDHPWLPARIYDHLNRLDFAYALVQDTGSFCAVGEHLWNAGKERRYLGSNNGRFMGVGIPIAIAASLSQTSQPVFLAVGDGGIRPYFPEVRLAVEEKLPICFLLMSDGRYGSIINVPQKRSMSTKATAIHQPSWTKLFESVGMPASAADSEASFMKAVEGWTRKGPCYIEAHFDPEAYAKMTTRLR